MRTRFTYEWLQSEPQEVEQMTIAANFARDAADETLSKDQRLHAWATGYQIERPDRSYRQALMTACKANPELHLEYLASNGSR